MDKKLDLTEPIIAWLLEPDSSRAEVAAMLRERGNVSSSLFRSEAILINISSGFYRAGRLFLTISLLSQWNCRA
jgi:hypothetical protein